MSYTSFGYRHALYDLNYNGIELLSQNTLEEVCKGWRKKEIDYIHIHGTFKKKLLCSYQDLHPYNCISFKLVIIIFLANMKSTE